MDLFRSEEFKDLASKTDEVCISIYMPAHRVGYEQQQDPVRLKNLLDEAEERLIASGIRSSDARALLDSARQLLVDSDFWQHQSDGLAVFIDGESTLKYRLPLNFDELIFIGERFYIKSLLPMLSNDGQFFVLAISLNDVRLLQGTRYTVDAIEMGNVPTSMAEALWFEDPERQLQWHSATQSPGGRGERPAAYHGHGAIEDDLKNNILRYFQRVDRELVDLLQNNNSPLVVAGVDYMLPIYQEANTYPNLIEEGITGNPDDLSPKDLHQRAWEVVGPFFSTSQQEAIARYEEQAGMGSDKASNDIQEVVKAAVYGRVDTLFVAIDMQCWGDFDAQEDTVLVHENFQDADQDLLDLAALHTINNSGIVYALPVVKVPGGEVLAAIFRYGYES
jgi:Bacterial archaeo-eukaryotic release factor family 7